MVETGKYFDLEIGDIIKLYVGSDECHYPMTFTVEECIEEYCEMRGWDFVRILEDRGDGRFRSGEFWYNREEGSWTDAFGNIANVQQAVTRMGSLMNEITGAMRLVQRGMREELSGWLENDE